MVLWSSRCILLSLEAEDIALHKVGTLGSTLPALLKSWIRIDVADHGKEILTKSRRLNQFGFLDWIISNEAGA